MESQFTRVWGGREGMRPDLPVDVGPVRIRTGGGSGADGGRLGVEVGDDGDEGEEEEHGDGEAIVLVD